LHRSGDTRKRLALWVVTSGSAFFTDVSVGVTGLTAVVVDVEVVLALTGVAVGVVATGVWLGPPLSPQPTKRRVNPAKNIYVRYLMRPPL
jgi:hypothetical protein